MNPAVLTLNDAVPAVRFSDEILRKNARMRLAGTSLLGIVLRQVISEAWVLRVLKGIRFRYNENSVARQAYRAMSISDFEGINARQQWANWRTVPRNLSGRIPDAPLFAIDLCCGVGHSTEVLACYLPEGSKILGMEFNPEFVNTARSRSERYRHQSGVLAEVQFTAQSVLETFLDETGVVVGLGCVDVVNCCGAVGVHFKPETTRVLAREVVRVLKEGGIALIDSGTSGTNARELTRIFEDLGCQRIHASRSCLFDQSLQICFKKL